MSDEKPTAGEPTGAGGPAAGEPLWHRGGVQPTVVVPAGLERQRRLGPDWAAWLDLLPRLAADLLVEWELAPTGEVWHGHCSLVLGVTTAAGEPAVLKVGFAGAEETRHEHLVLQRWGGDGAVRLLRADPRRRALLLERLGTGDLSGLDDLSACEVVAERYARLHVPALPQLVSAGERVGGWLDDLGRLPRDAPVPRRLVEQALATGADLLADPPPAVVLHGDLHYANVLAGSREPWTVIDPQPMAGDPHYELAPMLWNRFDELGSGVRDGIRARFHTLVDVAGLDEDRARAWVVVRMILNCGWTVADARRAGRALDVDERSWLTTCVTVAKAVQD